MNQSIIWIRLLFSFSYWSIADIFFGYFSWVLEPEVYTSLADVFYTVGYVFFILLLCVLNKTYKIELTLILSSIITFALFAFYVLYLSVFIFEVYKFTGNIVDLALAFTYPMLDLFIIVGSIVYYFREKEISLNRN